MNNAVINSVVSILLKWNECAQWKGSCYLPLEWTKGQRSYCSATAMREAMTSAKAGLGSSSLAFVMCDQSTWLLLRQATFEIRLVAQWPSEHFLIPFYPECHVHFNSFLLHTHHLRVSSSEPQLSQCNVSNFNRSFCVYLTCPFTLDFSGSPTTNKLMSYHVIQRGLHISANLLNATEDVKVHLKGGEQSSEANPEVSGKRMFVVQRLGYCTLCLKTELPRLDFGFQPRNNNNGLTGIWVNTPIQFMSHRGRLQQPLSSSEVFFSFFLNEGQWMPGWARRCNICLLSTFGVLLLWNSWHRGRGRLRLDFHVGAVCSPDVCSRINCVCMTHS